MDEQPTKQQFKLENVSHGQFYLEQHERNIDLEYADDDYFSRQHFTSFPEQVAFFPYGDVSECDMTVELGSSLPSFDGAAQVVTRSNRTSPK